MHRIDGRRAAFEATDEPEQSCAPQFARAGGLGSHAEVRLETGLHEWIGPVVRWARERAA